MDSADFNFILVYFISHFELGLWQLEKQGINPVNK